MKDKIQRALSALRRCKIKPAKIPAVKLLTIAFLWLGMLLRFGSYATGGNPIYIRIGDVNGDGIVSSADVFSLANFNAEVGSDRFIAADINADGVVNMADAFSLIRLIGGSENEYICAKELTLSSQDVTLYLGNANSTTVLSAGILPENATVKKIVWQSSDESIVRVEDGVLTAVGEGEAYVLASSADGQASAKCVVRVGVGVTGISFPVEEISLYEGDSPVMLVPTITPYNATNQLLVWQSSDWNVVGVDDYGGVTPISAGTAVIGVSSPEGHVTASVTINVLEEPEPEEAEMSRDAALQQSLTSGTFTNYLYLSRTLNSILDVQCGLYNIIYKENDFEVAQPADVAHYMNPDNFSSGTAKYQFLDLSVPNHLSADKLNEYLRGKGILNGMGQAFIDAANEYGISEAYLVAHACLESGNGSSRLAKGVEHDGTVVYNMFGIGAYDGNALRGGAAYAYSKGWTTPEAAIKGGAKWIAENYIYRSRTQQNTLYKMLWNPLSPGYHQYATDVGWAVKQAATIAKIIGGSDCLQIFEIPVYSGTYTGYVPNVVPKTTPDYLAAKTSSELPASDDEQQSEQEDINEQEAQEEQPEEPAEFKPVTLAELLSSSAKEPDTDIKDAENPEDIEYGGDTEGTEKAEGDGAVDKPVPDDEPNVDAGAETTASEEAVSPTATSLPEASDEPMAE